MLQERGAGVVEVNTGKVRQSPEFPAHLVGFLVGFCRVPCREIGATRHGSILHNQQLNPQMSEMSGFYRSRELPGNEVVEFPANREAGGGLLSGSKLYQSLDSSWTPETGSGRIRRL